jgi:hypothetical protein
MKSRSCSLSEVLPDLNQDFGKLDSVSSTDTASSNNNNGNNNNPASIIDSKVDDSSDYDIQMQNSNSEHSDICSITESSTSGNSHSSHSLSISNSNSNVSHIPTIPETAELLSLHSQKMEAFNDDNEEKSVSEAQSESQSESIADISQLNISTVQKKSHHRKKKPSPLPLEIEVPNCANAESLLQWMRCNFQRVKTQQLLHWDWQKKQIVAVFESCPECQQNTHSCYICKRIRVDDAVTGATAVKCKQNSCGYYYHMQCLESDADYNTHTKFYKNKTSFLCPRHHCWVCAEDEFAPNHRTLVRKFCAYCPRSYHRQCVLPQALSISVQCIENNDTILDYPAFRFDIIECGDSHCLAHESPADKQFGRDDEAIGIFNWQFENSDFQFYRLYATNFSIPAPWIDDYDRRKNQMLVNPFPSNFKIITKSKWTKKRVLAKKKGKKQEVIKCQCRDKNGGCKLDYTCDNFMMQQECDDSICGCDDFDLCQNRQFANCNTSQNVFVRGTNGCGNGAFARRDYGEGDIILEYVGEVISRDESDRRLQMMNENGAPNFYFFQVDSKTVIDATHMGNEARFLNHSCDPNCKTQKWGVRSEQKLGIFAARNIKKDEELTYDYQYEVPNSDITSLAKCLCGSSNCRRYLGLNKKRAKELFANEEKESGKKNRKRKQKKPSKNKSVKRHSKHKRRREHRHHRHRERSTHRHRNRRRRSKSKSNSNSRSNTNSRSQRKKHVKKPKRNYKKRILSESDSETTTDSEIERESGRESTNSDGSDGSDSSDTSDTSDGTVSESSESSSDNED